MFILLYLGGGSLFLATHYAVQELPPFLMFGARTLIAGIILYVWARMRGLPSPRYSHWKPAAIVGGLLFIGGGGTSTWAQQLIPSGTTAVLAALVPLWITLLNWIWGDNVKPTGKVTVGLLLGFTGITLLVGLEKFTFSGSRAQVQLNLLGILALVLSALSWSLGSLYSRHAHLPNSAIMSTALQQLLIGPVLILIGVLFGEPLEFDYSTVSPRAILSFSYLTIVGSLLVFSAYIWLLRVSIPTHVSTYAFVNPIVAIILGWILGKESLTLGVLLAAFVVLSGVTLVTISQTDTKKPHV